jgi:aminodeoxyfutalosine deaminase
MTNLSTSISIRWVIPVCGEPIRDGWVTVQAGRVVAIGKQPEGPVQMDLGQVALLPCWVNAHTHFEFSDLSHPLGSPGMPLPDWIALVIRHRMNQAADSSLKAITSSPERIESTVQAGKSGTTHSQTSTINPSSSSVNQANESQLTPIQTGWQESWSQGTGLAGEIATPQSFAATDYENAPLSQVVFAECLGLNSARVVESIAFAERVSTQARVNAPGNRKKVNWGLSPHAPYSTNWDLFVSVCEIAAASRLPLAMHLAESIDERELLANRTGGFVSMLQRLGLWQAELFPRYDSWLPYLERLSRTPRSLVIHGNYLTADDQAFIAKQRDSMSVVYCPRTHEYFQHERYPLMELLGQGINVALGTDSRSSNPDLNLWREVQCVRRKYPELSPQRVIELGTLAGAKALGRESEFGSIRLGSVALFASVPLSNDLSDWDDSLFADANSESRILEFSPTGGMRVQMSKPAIA